MVDIDPLSVDFATRHPESFGRILGRGGADESSRILEKLPSQIKASIVARLPAARIEELLASGRHKPEQWLADAPFDDALMLLSRIPRERRLALVNSLGNHKLRQRLLRRLQYPNHSVGAITSDIRMRINADAVAADVLAELRDLEGEDPGPLVVVDAGGNYLGMVDRWRLMIGDPPAGHVRDYIIKVRPVRPETPIDSIAGYEDWHTRNWLPVVDHRNRVLGGVSRAKVFQVAGRSAAGERSPGDVFTGLMEDLVYVLGSLMELIFTRRSAP